jgi:hypothetical protein
LEDEMPRSRRTQTSKEADAIAWQAEFLRVTAFPISGATDLLPNSWKQITGNNPDEISKHPPPMQSFEAGPFFGGRLSVGHQPGRIDLVLMPDLTTQSEGSQLRHIGDLGSAMKNMLPAAEKMFRPDVVMQRLAVGAVLLHPVETVADGYKVLRSILPVAREIPETASDFSLQLNVPVSLSVTGIGDIRINRLLRWAVARFQIMNMVGGGSGVPTQIVGGAETHVVRVEMDINTPADLAAPLSYQNILDVINHLAAMACAIATNRGWFPE